MLSALYSNVLADCSWPSPWYLLSRRSYIFSEKQCGTHTASEHRDTLHFQMVYQTTSSLIVARVKFEPESRSSHESSSSQVKFSFFFSSFVFNCCVKIMYQRYEDSKILLFFLFVYFSLPITTVYSCINLVRSCFSKK